MAIGVQAFQGARLREARLSRGYTKAHLAEMMGVTGTAITRYEDGIDKPQHEKVCAAASVLDFSYEFFLKPVWPENIGPIFWRSRANETKSARLMTEQRMRWFCEVFSFLEEEVDFPVFNLPKVDVPSDFQLITPDIIEKAAEDIRKAWKLALNPIPDVVLALENAGIPVINLDIASDKQDGFCFRSTYLNRPFVGLNTYDVSCVRARYDCAHELGHLILHKNVTSKQEADPSLHKIIEQQAYRFSGAFLFPKKSFFDEVGYPSLDYFCSLKKRWGISIGSMIFRASDLGMIDAEEKSELYKKLARRKWRGPLREPFDTELQIERPRMIRRGMEVVLSEGTFSRSGLLKTLALPDREVEKISNVDPGFFQSGELVQLAVPRRTKALRAIDQDSGEVIEFTKRFK